ncbi:hypothetical protein QBZ16_002044 [Prototheca wickerhamii]|uniref:mitogen-activated protein kinase n=1 Tax=Prototheca wickerhamii TaxID=3111 RepID=A0AAD9MI59_PROWI|nr:hypothetical protein QBZ16_002044 [Prototheca wickerhamii]
MSPSKPSGKGAYGVVCSAKHLPTSQKVAVKKITNAFENLIDARRTFREMKLLRYLRHENVIGLLDIMSPPPSAPFNDVYLVYELMDTDLHQIIRSSQPLTDEHFQYFIYQTLRGLKYIHSAGVLHRDLKPSNLLLNASCDLKIADFGLARTSTESNAFMTEYVVTRWYRAPRAAPVLRQLLCWHRLGCILAELLGRKPLFPGKDYINQLKLIIRMLGNPSEEELGFITASKARAYIRALSPVKPTDFKVAFPDASKGALDLLQRMLQFDPRKRISVDEALRHPWLAALHDEAAEPVAQGAFKFDFEDQELDEPALRRMVLDEISRAVTVSVEARAGFASSLRGWWGQHVRCFDATAAADTEVQELLTDDILRDCIERCPQLSIVMIHGCPRVGDGFLRTFGCLWRPLEVLDLQMMPGVTARGLARAIEGSGGLLKVFSLSSRSNSLALLSVEDALVYQLAAQAPLLTALHLNDTAITNLSLELIGRVWPALEVLTLDMTCAWDSQALNAVLCRFHEIRVFSAVAAAVDDSALAKLALCNDKLEAVRVSHCCQAC